MVSLVDPGTDTRILNRVFIIAINLFSILLSLLTLVFELTKGVLECGGYDFTDLRFT